MTNIHTLYTQILFIGLVQPTARYFHQDSSLRLTLQHNVPLEYMSLSMDFYFSSLVCRDSNAQIVDNEVYKSGEEGKASVYDTIHGKSSICFWPCLLYPCKNQFHLLVPKLKWIYFSWHTDVLTVGPPCFLIGNNSRSKARELSLSCGYLFLFTPKTTKVSAWQGD